MRTKTDSPNRADLLRLALRMAEEAQLIGGRIRERREELGLKQRELAERLPGKTEGKDVSRWENGRHRPSPNTLAEIAKVLETTVGDLHAGPVKSREAPKDRDLLGAFNGTDPLTEIREQLARIEDVVSETRRLVRDRLAEMDAEAELQAATEARQPAPKQRVAKSRAERKR